MYTFLLTLLILDAIILAIAVLLQSGKGGGLAASFGGASSSSDSVIGTRQAGNLLTKASWWCGGVFLGLAFILHGWVRLGTDFTEWRQPFILHDLGQWWANVQTWWANYRGIKVKVSR